MATSRGSQSKPPWLQLVQLDCRVRSSLSSLTWESTLHIGGDELLSTWDKNPPFVAHVFRQDYGLSWAFHICGTRLAQIAQAKTPDFP